MAKISRRAADEIKRTVQIVRGLPPGGASFADPGSPIRLAKTTAEHPTGATLDVRLMWGDKGSETEGNASRDTVPAFNRYEDIAENTEVHIARIGPGWEILNRDSSTSIAGGCGACLAVSGELTIPVSGDVDAKETYTFQPFCAGDIYLFEHDADLQWLYDGTFELDCGGESGFTLTFEMNVTGTSVGQVEILAKDGSTTMARWTNDTLWQPCIYVVMKLVSFDDQCPCAPWKPESCLLPVQV